MLKPKTLDISQTNIANLGSDLEKKVREAAAHGDPAWKECGKAVGLQIWRIEKFTVKAWPKNQYGEFYSGDSYIVLHTYQKTAGAPFSYDVHFWLGDHTTQDEYGTAAYKTVEVDDYLGGLPVQHRETQGNETKTFLSYFPHGIRILEGGCETGFRHVKPEEYRPRLLHVKGAGQNIRVQQTNLDRSALNSGDVFILDKGLKVFQFNGAKSAGAERMKAAQVVRAIDDERGSKVEVIVTEEGNDKEPVWEEFWTALGGRGAIKTAEEGGSDKGIQVVKRLYQLSDASGELKFTLVGEAGTVKRNLLNSNDVFILDDGGQIWAWVGKGSSSQEKAKALAYADMYLKKYNRPPLTPISRVLEGGENEQFEAAW